MHVKVIFNAFIDSPCILLCEGWQHAISFFNGNTGGPPRFASPGTCSVVSEFYVLIHLPRCLNNLYQR